MDLEHEIIITDEFRAICREITTENKNLEEWADIESDDMFQNESFVGGFDATEMEFTFSYYDNENKEWWFQISLNEINEISEGKDRKIMAKEAN